MNRMNKIARILAKSFSISLLSIGMLAAMPTPSYAAWLRFCFARLTVEYESTSTGTSTTPAKKTKWKATLDPESIESFNYSASFNPGELAFEEIVYEAPYTQTTLPDFSQLSSGLIQGIAGSTSTPVFGNADLFTLIFTELVPNPQSTINFFPGSQGFMVIRNSDTGETTTLDSSQCPSCETPVPTPEPLTLFASAASLGFGAVFKKQYSRNQKKAKTLQKLKA